MNTRRSFLLSGSVASPILASVAANTAIGRLKSRRSEAHPIQPEERQARIARAKRLLAENNLRAMLLTGGTSLTYFSGVRWWTSERLFAMLVPVNGEPFFVCPAFEEERAREQIRLGYGAAKPRVYTWQEDDNPYAVTASALKERGLAAGTIGIEETVKFVFADGIAKAIPSATLASATPVTAGCRAIKSPAELALMRLASDVTLQAYEAAWQTVREGMTQKQLSSIIAGAYQALGFTGNANVQTGAFTAMPHGSIEPQKIVEGTIVLIDDGCDVEGYQSDITRTLVLGKPTDAMKKVFDIVHTAQSAAVRAAKPGTPCEAVDAAARKVIDDAGYGPDYMYFSHRVGHGLGMDIHEWPYLVRGNKLPLAVGMTCSDEPGVYVRGQFGVRLEDDMVITEGGAQLFTPQSPSLEHPFARS